jgi:hypothetical protein
MFYSDYEGNFDESISTTEDEVLGAFFKDSYDFHKDLGKLLEDSNPKNNHWLKQCFGSKSALLWLFFPIIYGATYFYVFHKGITNGKDLFSVALGSLLTIATIVPTVVTFILERNDTKLNESKSIFAPRLILICVAGFGGWFIGVISSLISLFVNEDFPSQNFKIWEVLTFLTLSGTITSFLLSPAIFRVLLVQLKPNISTRNAIIFLRRRIAKEKLDTKRIYEKLVRDFQDLAILEQDQGLKDSVRNRLLGLAALASPEVCEGTLENASVIEGIGYLGQTFAADRQLAIDVMSALLTLGIRRPFDWKSGKYHEEIIQSYSKKDGEENEVREISKEIEKLIEECVENQNLSNRIILIAVKCIAILSRPCEKDEERTEWLSRILDYEYSDEQLLYILPLLITLALPKNSREIPPLDLPWLMDKMARLNQDDLETLRNRFNRGKHPVAYLTALWQQPELEDDSDVYRNDNWITWRNWTKTATLQDLEQIFLKDESIIKVPRDIEELVELSTFAVKPVPENQGISLDRKFDIQFFAKFYELFFTPRNFEELLRRRLNPSESLKSFIRYSEADNFRNQISRQLIYEKKNELFSLIKRTAGTFSDLPKAYVRYLMDIYLRIYRVTYEGVDETSLSKSDLGDLLKFRFSLLDEIRRLKQKIIGQSESQADAIQSSLQLSKQLTEIINIGLGKKFPGAYIDIVTTFDIRACEWNKSDKELVKARKQFLHLLATIPPEFAGSDSAPRSNAELTQFFEENRVVIRDLLEKKLEEALIEDNRSIDKYGFKGGNRYQLYRWIVSELTGIIQSEALNHGTLQSIRILPGVNLESKTSDLDSVKTFQQLFEAASFIFEYRLGSPASSRWMSRKDLFSNFRSIAENAAEGEFLGASPNEIFGYITSLIKLRQFESTKTKEIENNEILRLLNTYIPIFEPNNAWSQEKNIHHLYFFPDKEGWLKYDQHVLIYESLIENRKRVKYFVCSNSNIFEERKSSCRLCELGDKPRVTYLPRIKKRTKEGTWVRQTYLLRTYLDLQQMEESARSAGESTLKGNCWAVEFTFPPDGSRRMKVLKKAPDLIDVTEMNEVETFSETRKRLADYLLWHDSPKDFAPEEIESLVKLSKEFLAKKA